MNYSWRANANIRGSEFVTCPRNSLNETLPTPEAAQAARYMIQYPKNEDEIACATRFYSFY